MFFQVRDPLADPVYTYEIKPGNEGWICPKCGSVYSPLVAECLKCNGKKTETGDTSLIGNEIIVTS
jgi:uncharacterized OB-fold protein